MVDLQKLRRAIKQARAKGPAATVTREWLQDVERDLTELAALRAAGRTA